jgi:hypothetical protein
VERVINQMQVPKELRVDCVSQLLIEDGLYDLPWRRGC